MAHPTYADVVKHRPERNNGIQGDKKKDKNTVLQRHIGFWDVDHDGVIWPKDTFDGFYKLGFGVIVSVFAVFVIHGVFSYPTQQGWFPDPFFRIFVTKIYKDKHGSDSGVYDNKGEFSQERFDNLFETYSSLPDKSGLTRRDTFNLIRGQRCAYDLFGLTAVIFEWGATWILLRPENGVIMKDDLLAVYDGSIFGKIAHQREVTIKV